MIEVAVRASRLLLLDYGGVLVQSPFDQVRSYAAMYDVAASDAVRMIFGNQDRGCDTAPWKLLEKGKISYQEYRDLYQRNQLTEKTPLPCPSLDEIYDLAPNTALLELVDTIDRNEWNVGIATNNIAEMRSFWHAQVHAENFSVIFDSSAIGCRKPESEFYRDVVAYAETHAIPVSSVWLVDDVEANVVAAEEFGLNGLVAAKPYTAVEQQIRALLSTPA